LSVHLIRLEEASAGQNSRTQQRHPTKPSKMARGDTSLEVCKPTNILLGMKKMTISAKLAVVRM
jgi:hypothetical protein